MWITGASGRRRAHIRRIVGRMQPRQRQALVPALADFAEAAGEVPEGHWFLGWR